MEEAYHANLTRAIGVSNFNITQLQHILKNGYVKPLVNQVEIHPYLTQEPLVNFCHENNIAVVAYSPIAKANQTLFKEPVLVEMAAKHEKTVPQVIMRWHQFSHQRQHKKMSLWSFSISLLKIVCIIGVIAMVCETGPSRRQCGELISALQLMGAGHASRVSGIKRLSLENMPNIYTDCLHAEEGIRFKKSLKRHLMPYKMRNAMK
ncbi:unnamed protein product [Medioppia subpectinata]|uniref:NADP-dependent oxidoreductase domain-containing protein n=1 Tax=Medioppia subpectinata TaxID=1979941 RepID=A0A7R9L4L7_9ACAR|nr:unnamed protein product [Medioppia subpectinata]CAG2115251.1 unnamed protein product [Medioppia subpectinata]